MDNGVHPSDREIDYGTISYKEYCKKYHHGGQKETKIMIKKMLEIVEEINTKLPVKENFIRKQKLEIKEDDLLDVISIIRMGIEVARENKTLSEELLTKLEKWCNDEEDYMISV